MVKDITDKASAAKQYIYIVQAASVDRGMCKIGKTNDLKRRLNEYNQLPYLYDDTAVFGNSRKNIYKYLFTCEVENMARLENAVKKKLFKYRPNNREYTYFFNEILFLGYIHFIRSHKLFVKELFMIKKKWKYTEEEAWAQVSVGLD